MPGAGALALARGRAMLTNNQPNPMEALGQRAATMHVAVQAPSVGIMSKLAPDTAPAIDRAELAELAHLAHLADIKEWCDGERAIQNRGVRLGEAAAETTKAMGKLAKAANLVAEEHTKRNETAEAGAAANVAATAIKAKDAIAKYAASKIRMTLDSTLDDAATFIAATYVKPAFDAAEGILGNKEKMAWDDAFDADLDVAHTVKSVGALLSFTADRASRMRALLADTLDALEKKQLRPQPAPPAPAPRAFEPRVPKPFRTPREDQEEAPKKPKSHTANSKLPPAIMEESRRLDVCRWWLAKERGVRSEPCTREDCGFAHAFPPGAK